MKINCWTVFSSLLVISHWLSCTSSEKKKEENNSLKSTIQRAGVDTISSESQIFKIGNKKKRFFLDSGIAKVVGYSFLDVHDYEDDSMSRGQLLNIMPNYSQYLWKYDPHPKVALTKSQIFQLISIINNPKCYGYGTSFCYYPRNCFCFYNSKDEIIGFYEICFECTRIQSMPEFDISRKGGLNETGVSELRKFCKSSGISILK